MCGAVKHESMKVNPVARRLWSVTVLPWPDLGPRVVIFTCARCKGSFVAEVA